METRPNLARFVNLCLTVSLYSALVLHQRARMDKLVKDLEEARKMLNGMQTEVKQLEKTANHRRLVRSNSFPKVGCQQCQQLLLNSSHNYDLIINSLFAFIINHTFV